MKFGGLSENDVKKISEILGQEGISFSVDKDQELEDFNKTSMSNNLRHYSPPNISTHILAIDIEDEDFLRMSESARKKLQNFGITDQVPAPEDFVPFTGETIHKEMNRSQNRLIGMTNLHIVIISLVVLALAYLVSQLPM